MAPWNPPLDPPLVTEYMQCNLVYRICSLIIQIGTRQERTIVSCLYAYDECFGIHFLSNCVHPEGNVHLKGKKIVFQGMLSGQQLS